MKELICMLLSERGQSEKYAMYGFKHDVCKRQNYEDSANISVFLGVCVCLRGGSLGVGCIIGTQNF